MTLHNGAHRTWIFGYGSLIWRPDFPHAERRVGYIKGFARRFWQASPDHRGTQEYPGRVVTLVREPGATCWGAAYAISAADTDRVLKDLDHRERAGYEREMVEVFLTHGSSRISALVYRAGPENPNFVQHSSVFEIVERVQRAHGPSGANSNYVVELASALRSMGAHDAHVFEIESLISTSVIQRC